MSAAQVDVVANLRALADTLESARRFGVPMPFTATATDYTTPTLQVHDAEAWHAWADYLDLKAARMLGTSGAGRDHLLLEGASAECPHLTVIALVPQATGAEHVAAAIRRNPLPKPLDEKIEEGAARHAARAAELGTVTTDS